MEFTKGKAVCGSCRAAIIKAERTRAKFAENEEQHAVFYRQATEKDNRCLITPTQYEELRKYLMRFNITPMKDWPSPVNSMCKIHFEDMFKKRYISLEAIHKNININIEI